MKKYKHWIVLVLCCGLSASSIGVSINCSGVFYTPVAEALGLLRGSFAFHMTVFSMVSAFASFVIPTLMKKFSYKTLLISSVTLSVVATCLMGKVNSLVFFYILGAIRGATTAIFATVPLTMIINNWFVEKHGLATSIVFSFSGVAGTVFSPFLSSCVEKYGWQNSYMIMGIMILVLTLPSIIYPFQLNPMDEDVMPFGGLKKEVKNEVKETSSFNFISLSFVLFLTFGLSIAFLTSFTQHFPGYASTLGYNASLGALLVSAGMIGNIIFKLLIGVLSDKFGVVKAVIILMITVLSGVVLLLINLGDKALILGSFLFGASYAIGAVGTALLTKHFFGVELYSKVYPSVSFSINMGSAFAFSLVGYIYDFFGTYTYAFILALILLVGCFMAIGYIIKTREVKA